MAASFPDAVPNAGSKKVLFVLSSSSVVPGTKKPTGWFLPELVHPFFRFKKAGYDCKICSIQGGSTTVAPSSVDLSDADNKEFWDTPAYRSLTENTQSLATYNGAQFDVIFFVGGYGPMFDFPFQPDVDRVGREVYEHGGIVGGVCHGSIALANIRNSAGQLIVVGKRVAAFSNDEEVGMGLVDELPKHANGAQSCEDVLLGLGAKYTKGIKWGIHVENDDRIVTGQNPASAGPTASSIIASQKA